MTCKYDGPFHDYDCPDCWRPLSVRHGNRRKRLGWWWKGRRQRIALRLAPWLETLR